MTQDYLNGLMNPTFAQPQQIGGVEYKPSADKGVGGVYQAKIRFVVWHKDPSNNYIGKKTAFIEHPFTKVKKVVDCPSSIGERSPLIGAYCALKNANSPEKDRFKSSQGYYAIIQVVEDNQQPNLVGKLLIWRYGIKVQELIDRQLKPISNDIKPSNPFSPLDGNVLMLHITKKSNFNNYDNCQFLNQPFPLVFRRSPESQLEYASQENFGELVEFLKRESPNLDEYRYKPWTPEVTDFVNEVIAVCTGTSMAPTQAGAVINGQPMPQGQPMGGYSMPQQQYSQPAMPQGQPMGGYSQQMPSAQPVMPQGQPMGGYNQQMPSAQPVMPQTQPMGGYNQMPPAQPAQPVMPQTQHTNPQVFDMGNVPAQPTGSQQYASSGDSELESFITQNASR